MRFLLTGSLFNMSSHSQRCHRGGGSESHSTDEEMEAGRGGGGAQATGRPQLCPWAPLLGPSCSDPCWLWWSVFVRMEQTPRTIPDASLPTKPPSKRPRGCLGPPHCLAAPGAQQTRSGVTVISLDLRNRRTTGETMPLLLPEELCHFISMMSEFVELCGV